MRWTIRGIHTETADAVRDVADETGRTIGDVVMQCVQHGLPEARRCLEAENNAGGEIGLLFHEVRLAFAGIQTALSKVLSGHGGTA